jgi:hypothetical protein
MLAATALAKREWNGVFGSELLGQRDLSYAEATRIIGERRQTGAPIRSVVVCGRGKSARAGGLVFFANLYVEMTRGFNENRIKPSNGRTPENTTSTRFEEFAEELAQAYKAM